MTNTTEHDCSEWPDEYYREDDGWDTGYCPEIPRHDVMQWSVVNKKEVIVVGDGSMLIYDAETKERIVAFSPTEVDVIREVLSE